MASKKRKTTGKNAVTFSLTSQAIDRLAEMARQTGLSRSAFIENLATGYVAIAAPAAQKQLNLIAENPAQSVSISSINVVENSATQTDSTPVKDPELEAKISSQARRIQELEAKLAASTSPLKRPVARPNEQSSKSAPIQTKPSGDHSALKKELAAQVAQLKTTELKRHTLEQELAQAMKQNSDLQARLDQQANVAKQYQEELRELTVQLERSTQIQATLQQQVDEQDKTISTLKAVQAELPSASDIKSLEEQLQASAQTYSRLQSEQEKLQTELQQSRKVKTELSHELDQQKQATKTLEKTLQQLQAEAIDPEAFHSLEQTLVEKAQAIANLKQTLLTQQQKYSQLQQDYSTQATQRTILEERLQKLASTSSIGETYLNRWRRY